jgi:hypothetical protein
MKSDDKPNKIHHHQCDVYFQLQLPAILPGCFDWFFCVFYSVCLRDLHIFAMKKRFTMNKIKSISPEISPERPDSNTEIGMILDSFDKEFSDSLRSGDGVRLKQTYEFQAEKINMLLDKQAEKIGHLLMLSGVSRNVASHINDAISATNNLWIVLTSRHLAMMQLIESQKQSEAAKKTQNETDN